MKLVGCGMLEREVRWLVQRNGWQVAPQFLEAQLDVDPEALSAALGAALAGPATEAPRVVYGQCHPQMEAILEATGAIRIDGQNCIELLLGAERYTEELANGAYFLLEQGARTWETVLDRAFGSRAVAREVFRGDRRSLLCLRTPCSGDFRHEAEALSACVGLPLRWEDVELTHLEARLAALVAGRP